MDDVVAEKKAVQMQPITTPLTRTPKNKKKKKNNRALWNYLFNLAACCLITFSLLGIDFVLFSASGPVNVFVGSGLRSEVFYMLAGMGAAIVLVYFIFSFLSIIIYLLTALTTGLFTYSMVHQFANFNAGTGGGSETFGAVVAGVVVFCILMFTPKRFKALLVMVAVFCFGAVLANQNRPASEFLIEPDMPAALAAAEEEGEKTVTLMIANAPSYSYLASLEKTDAAEMYKNRLMEIMLGFYAKNGFRLYPNAYVTHNNHFVNAARNLNYAAGEEVSFLQTQVLKEGYWQFRNREEFEAYLKDNAVYDDLKEKGYKISAYQSHGINLCDQNNAAAVNRCVTKVNFPLNLDGVNLPTGDKMQVLLFQWLESTGLFSGEGMMKTVYGWLKPFFNPSRAPLVGISYKKLYVVNSFANIDMLISDMAEDKGRHAYFVYLDLPADMYVYDDMCRLLPVSQWLPKYNQPWVDKQSLLEKRNAYLKQTMCLFGQLEKLMQAIRKMPQGDKVSVIIEGLSGMDDLVGSDNENLSERFRNAQMVTLAIRLPASNRFVINQSICPVEEILANQFAGGPKCTEFGRTTLSKSTKKAIKEDVSSVRFTGAIAQKSLQEFNSWYKQWSKVNYQAPKSLPLTKTNPLLPPAAQPVGNTPPAPQPAELMPPTTPETTAQADAQPVGVPMAADPSLPPLEEKNLAAPKIMDKEVAVGAEAAVAPLSTVSGEAVAAE